MEQEVASGGGSGGASGSWGSTSAVAAADEDDDDDEEEEEEEAAMGGFPAPCCPTPFTAETARYPAADTAGGEMERSTESGLVWREAGG